VRIDFLYWRGCPSHPEARELLGEVLAARGIEAEVVEREVTTDEEAQELAFPGSPTIRVDGRDIAAPGSNPIGLTCRVYRLRDGRISALPDPADIADALRAATEGGEG
jgi:hypothetical protein